MEHLLEGSENGENPRPAFFYCSRNTAEPGRSDPRGILASIARQLSSLKPGNPILKPTVDLYCKHEKEAFASTNIRIEESCELILQLTDLHPLTIIVIDALDECSSKGRDVVKALEQILRDSSSLIKIFISSRADQDIAHKLNSYPNLLISSDMNQTDIEAFVKHRTEALIKSGELLSYSDSLTEMKELIIKRVNKGAAGM